MREKSYNRKYEIFLRRASCLKITHAVIIHQKKKKKSAPNVTEHVTKGFTAFQKVLTAVGTILSIIVASITIMNFTASKNKDTSDSSANQSTVVIKEGNNKTQESSATSSSYGNATDSETETSSQAGTNTYSSSADTTTGGNTTTSSSVATADTTSGNATTGGATAGDAASN